MNWVRLPRLALWRHMLAAQQRERQHLLVSLVQVRGLMPMLMKRRNGGQWTREERIELQQQLLAIRHLSPYLLVLALPGSFLMLPALAWWLDRRRGRRDASLPVEPG